MPIQDVSLKTYRKRWTIEKGGERGLGRSVLMARHDDDDDDEKERMNERKKAREIEIVNKENRENIEECEANKERKKAEKVYWVLHSTSSGGETSIQESVEYTFIAFNLKVNLTKERKQIKRMREINKVK